MMEESKVGPAHSLHNQEASEKRMIVFTMNTVLL